MTSNSKRITVTSVQNNVVERERQQLWQRLIIHFVSISLGIVGGGAGVVSTIAGLVGIQFFFVTDGEFLPNLSIVAVAASFIGVGVSWILYYIVQQFSPFALLRNLNQDSLQVIFVVSVLTSLLETFLFVQNIFTRLTSQIQYLLV